MLHLWRKGTHEVGMPEEYMLCVWRGRSYEIRLSEEQGMVNTGPLSIVICQRLLVKLGLVSAVIKQRAAAHSSSKFPWLDFTDDTKEGY
jgi:hypothetical protein